MSDEQLRAAEKRWRESGTPEAEAAYLRERVRAHDLEAEQLRLAAVLGDPVARIALGSDEEWPALGTPEKLFAALAPFGALVLGRAATIGCRLVQPCWDEHLSSSPLFEETVSLVEDWLACPRRPAVGWFWSQPDFYLAQSNAFSARPVDFDDYVEWKRVLHPSKGAVKLEEVRWDYEDVAGDSPLPDDVGPEAHYARMAAGCAARAILFVGEVDHDEWPEGDSDRRLFISLDRAEKLLLGHAKESALCAAKALGRGGKKRVAGEIVSALVEWAIRRPTEACGCATCERAHAQEATEAQRVQSLIEAFGGDRDFLKERIADGASLEEAEDLKAVMDTFADDEDFLQELIESGVTLDQAMALHAKRLANAEAAVEEARLLRTRVAAEEVSPETLELTLYLGHLATQWVLEREPKQVRRTDDWLQGLKAWGAPACARAALACSRVSLREAFEAGAPGPEAALQALEDLVGGDSSARTRLERLLEDALETWPPAPSDDFPYEIHKRCDRGVQCLRESLTAAMADSSYAAARALTDAGTAALSSMQSRDEELLRNAVGEALVPWALAREGSA